MRIVSAVSLVILVIILLAGCSDRKNVIGEESDLHPYLVEVKSDTLFQYHYSYENKTATFLRNDKSISGSFGSNESITLLRFAGLPDSGFVVTEEPEPELRLQIKNHYNTEGMVLRLGMVKQFWHHFSATWEYAEEDVEWKQSWDDLSTVLPLEGAEYQVSEEDSTVVFSFSRSQMQEMVEGWILPEAEGYGFAVYTDAIEGEDAYIEFYSRETDEGPVLAYDFLETEEDTTVVSYDKMPAQQTFINSRKPVDDYYLGDDLVVGNIVPTRSLIRLNLFEEFFDPLPADGDLKKISINKAELILFRQKDEDKYHFAEPRFELFPHIVINQEYSPDDLDKLPVIVDDLETISPSFTSVISDTEDSSAVDITSIVQAHISELRDNKGFVITSSLENKDNGFISFYSQEHEDENKRPYLRILYSLPFIPE